MDANDVESGDDDFYYSDGVYYDNDGDDVMDDDDDGPDYDFMAEAVDDPDDLSSRSQVIFLFGCLSVVVVIKFAALYLNCAGFGSRGVVSDYLFVKEILWA